MKNQRFKRLLCLTLSASLILGEPTVALAAEDAEAPQEITKVEESVRGTDEVEGDYSYWIQDGTVEITGYSGSDTKITIPSTIEDYTVTSIGYVAFRGNENIESISIPNGVTDIGIGAFADCTNLTNINIPNSVTSIGNGAFQHCTNLTNISIPNSVTCIESTTFEFCTKLKSINMSTSVTRIEYNAFADSDDSVLCGFCGIYLCGRKWNSISGNRCWQSYP